jgi:3-methyladenine DNA glycosylase AlkD
LLDDEEPVIRGAVAWALSKIGGGVALEALRGRLPREADRTVQEELRLALQSLRA